MPTATCDFSPSAARMRRLKSKYFLALSRFSIPKSKKERIRTAELRASVVVTEPKLIELSKGSFAKLPVEQGWAYCNDHQ